ncbi:MAG: hypothetical protein ACRECX_03375 [Methyloceanibacter sp.]|uniref:hypothetical protein n=1 Tax=Methyloceanibacter sp. TaxID=1965321 RepID=UPI003D6D8F11
MRIAATLALAAIGVLVAALPCAAQSGAVSVTPKTSSVAKQSAPQRLSPPEAPAPKAAREDTQPESTQPVAAAPRRVPPQEVEAPKPHDVLPPAPEIEPVYIERTEQQQQSAFSSPERLIDWVSNYRKHPNIWSVPPAVRAMLDYGVFGDEEKQWFCIGFIAGILGTNPKDGPALITKMFPMPDKEQEVLIRAIAYSGRPDWRELLEKNSSRMPLRRPLIDDFLNGKRPVLMDLPLDHGGAPGIYALWGYYVATGQHEPVMRIMEALKWSKNKEDSGFSFRKIFSGWGTDPSAVDKITTGGTAKWTLASYAERDRELIRLYRSEYERQPPEISKPLKDVIEAAELFESESIRKDQFGAIEDAQKRQLSAEAGMSKGMSAGSIAIATGCVAATALGQAQIAVPCVIGGALYTGAAKLAH